MKRKQFLNHLLKISENNQYNIANKDKGFFLQSELLHHPNLNQLAIQSISPGYGQNHCLELMKKEVLILEDKRHFVKWANQLKLKRMSQKRASSKLKFMNKEKSLRPILTEEKSNQGQLSMIENELTNKIEELSGVKQQFIKYSNAGDNYLSIKQIQPQIQQFKRQPLKRSHYKPKILANEEMRRKSLTQASQSQSFVSNNQISNKYPTSRLLWLNNPQQSYRNVNKSINSNQKKNKHVDFNKHIKQSIEKTEKIQMKKHVYKHYNKQPLPPPKISAKSYIIYEVKQNPQESKIIISHQSKNSVEVASLTKIMTCILVIEICRQFCVDKYAQEVTIGTIQSSVGGTTASLQIGQIYSIHQLLYGLMLPSGNDASVALAVWAGKKLLQKQKQGQDKDKGNSKSKQNITELNQHEHSESCLSTSNSNKIKSQNKTQCYARFIVEMNTKAKSLQMIKTNYANSHGLMNQKNKSSAYDMAILCQYAMKNQIFRDIVHSRFYKGTIRVNDKQSTQYSSTSQLDDSPSSLFKQAVRKQAIANKQYRSKSKKQKIIQIQWQNTHKLMHLRPKEYLGIKTGFTNAAGPCLSSYISISNRNFIIIVLGCSRMNLRFKETQILKKWLQKQENICKKKKKKQDLQNEQEKSCDFEVFQRQEQIEQQRAKVILKQLNDDQIQD